MAENELIQLSVTKEEFDLLLAAHLAVTTQATGRVNLSILTMSIALGNFLANREAVTSLNRKFNIIDEAIKEEPENCSNPNCPIHGESEEAKELRRVLGI